MDNRDDAHDKGHQRFWPCLGFIGHHTVFGRDLLLLRQKGYCRLEISRGRECSSMGHRLHGAPLANQELVRRQCHAAPGWYLRKLFRHEH